MLKHYHSDRGVLDHQAEGMARVIVDGRLFAIWDLGTGKSHLAMITAALGFEDNEIDVCIVVAERDKLDDSEWPNDFATFTDLDVGLYHGPRRAKLRDALPQVLLTTYETFKADVATVTSERNPKTGRQRKVMRPGPLLELIRNKRVLLVYDESSKLGNRASGLHKAHQFAVDQIRTHGRLFVVGMTGTPIERGPENFYNAARIIAPEICPNITTFEKTYINAKNVFGKPASWKNLDEDFCQPGVTPLARLFAPVISVKRKTDEDIRHLFPERTLPEYTYVTLGARQRDFYDTVRDLALDDDEMAAFTFLRQVAGHPASLVHSKGKLAQKVTAEVGEAGLRSLGSAKLDRLMLKLEPLIVGQGAQLILFSYFTSILVLIEERFTEAGFDFVCNWPGRDTNLAKKKFRSGETQIFLSSDAGSRGLNLPCPYVWHFELPLNASTLQQREGRADRAFSDVPTLSTMAFVVHDTVEDGIANLVLRKEEYAEKLVPLDEDASFGTLTSAQRRQLLRIGKRAVQ